MTAKNEIDHSFAAAESELAQLNDKRAEVIARLQELRREKTLHA